MFRKMRRFKQQLSDEECLDVLRAEKRGVLSVIGDDGYPYGIPMNHVFSEEEGKLFFHCAKEGHKLDAVRRCDKVCFTVFEKGFRKEGEWALNVRSVVIFGRVSVVSDEERKKEICASLCRKFTDDEEYIEREIGRHLPNALCLELAIEHMTGKLVNES